MSRSALALVARGEAPLGIVYRTDALVEPKVRIVDTFPKDTHPPIVYPAALTTIAASRAARRASSSSCDRPRRAPIFERHGFIALAS